MMLNLYFPGNSPLNKNELDEFVQMYKHNDVEYYAHEWTHWKEDDHDFKLEKELDTVMKHLMRLKGVHDYGIMAKSIGTYFSCELISRLPIQPKYIVLMGVPTGLSREQLDIYEPALERANTNLFVIQNEGDPFGPLEDVQELLTNINYQEVLKEGNNHLYSYSNEAYELVKQWIS